MKKTALLIALCFSATLYSQTPAVPKSPTPAGDRLREMMRAGALNRAATPTAPTAASAAPGPATAGLPAPTTGLSQTPAPTPPQPATGAPAPAQTGSAQNIPPLTPAEIQIIRRWIQQGGLTASAPVSP